MRSDTPALPSPAPLIDPTVPCIGYTAGLVVLCGRGHDLALGRLFDLFLPTVLGVVGNGTSSEHADTLAVETFHDVWLHASDYDPLTQDVVAWVLDRARAVRDRSAAGTGTGLGAR